MYLKFRRLATVAAFAIFAAGCSSMMPWHDEPIGQEVNVAFILRNNLLFLPAATVDKRPGKFLFGSANARTVLDSKFAGSNAVAQHSIQLTPRETLRVNPLVTDLGGVGDGIVGADVWGTHAVSIDYHAGLLTYQKEGIYPDMMSLYSFTDAPMVNVMVDGHKLSAIVDTASPDTLVLPRGQEAAGRRKAHVQVATTDFGGIDVQLADVSAPRIGNRLLSRFLVSIDYGKKQVGLWRDPRIAL